MQLYVRSTMLIFVSLLAASLHGQTRPKRISAWDTVRSSTRRMTSEDLTKRSDWKKLSRRQKPKSFGGDAVISNGRILTVLRKKGAAVDVYAVNANQSVLRVQARLQTIKGHTAAKLENVAVVEHTRAAVRLQAEYLTAAGVPITASFRIKRGGISLETSPGPGAGQIRIEAVSRYVVLPDFFADDILIDAAKIPVPRAELPSENFLLHLTGNGNSIAMCVFENRDQDVLVTFAGSGKQRVVTGSVIRFGESKKNRKNRKKQKGSKDRPGRKVWVSLIEGKGIWHGFDVKREDAGKIRRLNWQAPYPAQWRTDFTRRNGLTDSWEMLYPDKDGKGFIKPSWLPSGAQGNKPSLTSTGKIDVDAYKVGGPASNRLGPDRKRWITVLGRYQYPCWTDKQHRGYVQPLKHRRADLEFLGSAVVYPIHRLPSTPIDQFTTVDVVRSTLGVGPCKYILSVEGQRQDHVGRATCHVRRLLKEIYGNKQQKLKQKEINIYLGDALDFVKHIRKRIDLYIDFRQKMGAYIAAQKKAHPDLTKTLTEMEKLLAELDSRVVRRRRGIKSPKFVIALNNEFRKNLLNYDGADSLIRLKRYTDALTGVGGSQDTLVGECRWIVRALRQRAALAMAVDPRFAPIAKEIRSRTQKVLLKPSAYEGARH